MHPDCTLLIASADIALRELHATQPDADGHTIYEADHAAALVANLSTDAIDVLILGDLEQPADGPRLLRALRAGELHTRVHCHQPVITLGNSDELSTLRAYEAGSDHHLAADSGYLVLRAVVAALLRRAYEELHNRHVYVGALHIDTSAQLVDVDGLPVRVSRTEYELLLKLASEPTRVFTKAQLAHSVWGREQLSGRTLDSHIARLRGRCADADVIQTRWGVGWALTSPEAD
jgi:DNA-binding response OmpR family regulator